MNMTTNTNNTNDFNKAAPSISSSAMLVELNISVWTGRKFDKEVSAEIDQTKHATTRAGNYHKKLFADEPKFEAIAKHAGNTRTFHYAQTMPWSDSGVRLLTTPVYFDYHKRMTEELQTHRALVQDCLDDWDGMVQRAQRKLGNLFNFDDYPDRETVANKYAFNLRYLPVPEVGDFRVDVGAEALSYLNESYSNYYTEKIQSAYADVWDRLHQALNNMSTRLDGTTKQIFRDTLVSNVTEIVDLLGKFNVTGDSKLQAAERKIRFALLGVTPESLREDDEFRLETKSKVDDLLKEFAW